MKQIFLNVYFESVPKYEWKIPQSKTQSLKDDSHSACRFSIFRDFIVHKHFFQKMGRQKKVKAMRLKLDDLDTSKIA